MILTSKTIDKFGYDPNNLTKMSGKKIIYQCLDCQVELEAQMATYSRSKTKTCLSCSRSRSHKNKKSGYNNSSYRKLRSVIASKSNKNRKVSSEKYQKYLPYLDKLRKGEISFLEISKELNLDDSTVCKFFHNNFNLRSKINYSTQEIEVGKMIDSIIGTTEKQKRYSSNSKYKSDYYHQDFGHIEYDGAGFFHLKKSDKIIDSKYSPIRLNAQALFGGVDYLNLILKDTKTGYCSVTSPKQYGVKIIDNRKNSTEMLENCHILGNCAGSKVFGLYYKEKLVGVAKFGNTTNRHDKDMIELRRFFVLDGTPKNTESYFLRQCEKQLTGKLVTYIHSHERGSYLLALGWKKIEKKQKMYDVYVIDGKTISKRRMWGWAKKVGLVDKFGTTKAKEVLADLLGAKKILEPSKIKFTKVL